MESARPLGEGTHSTSPSIFDVLAHESAAALLPRLSPPRQRLLKLLTFIADLVAMWLAKGRLTELLFGIERTGNRPVMKFIIERAIEEATELIDFSKVRWLQRAIQVIDIGCKLLYITGDSRYYGLSKSLLRIPYQQQFRPNEVLRWALFWGQAVVTILTRFQTSKSKQNTLSQAPLPLQQAMELGRCPGCLQSLAWRDKLFMLPEKGIAHCSTSCLGKGVSNALTLHL